MRWMNDLMTRVRRVVDEDRRERWAEADRRHAERLQLVQHGGRDY